MRTRPTILFYSPDGAPGARRWSGSGPRRAASRCWSSGAAGRGRVHRPARAPRACSSSTATSTGADGARPGAAAQDRRVHRHRAGRRSSSGTHAPERVRRVVRGRRRRGDHRLLRPGGAAGAARRHAGADRARRLGASLDPAAGHHRDRARDPAPAGVGRRSSRSATPTSTTSRNTTTATATTTATGSSIILSRILHDVVKGLLGAARVRRAHRRRRLHLRHPGRPRSARSAARS